MKLTILFVCSAVLCGCAIGHPVKYDQRQEGDLNVRTDVEDVVFVVVPPQDLVAAGMGIVAATAADLLRKNYGPIGPERWPLRTPTKVGFIPLEKSPYKVDLEKTGLKVKKISHAGDPNRYNFHDSKTPMKVSPDVKAETPEKPVLEMITEMVDEMSSTTESKTVKKVLKPEDLKKAPMEEEKKKDKLVPEVATKTEETKLKTPEKMTEDTKQRTSEKVAEEIKHKTTEKMGEENKPKTSQRVTEETKPTTSEKILEGVKTKTPEKMADETKTKIHEKKAEDTKTKTVDNVAAENLKVVGEGTKDGLDASSIFRIEGCGPDAYRDSTGKCVYKI